MVQEYGRYFGMPTVCFRGGCLTGPNHSGAELHGFLAYLARCVARGPRRTASSATRASRCATTSTPTTSAPRSSRSTSTRAGAVYNLGGGRANSVSILEAIARLRGADRDDGSTTEYVDENRVGDHICYISDLRRLQGRLSRWQITRSLDDILRELASGVPGPV